MNKAEDYNLTVIGPRGQGTTGEPGSAPWGVAWGSTPWDLYWLRGRLGVGGTPKGPRSSRLPGIFFPHQQHPNFPIRSLLNRNLPRARTQARKSGWRGLGDLLRGGQGQQRGRGA